MAEPARQLYDKDNERPIAHPDLQALEGGGESSPPTEKLHSVDDNEESAPDLSAAEKTPNLHHERQLGKGYTAKNKPKTRGRFSRRQRLIGLGVGGGIGAGIIGVLLFFLPMLRLESYLNNINQRVFGFASNAVEQRAENLFGRYMIMRVIHMDKCGTNVTGTCSADYTNMGIGGSAFNAWRDAKVEQKLIDEYGLKFETHKNSSTKYGYDRITIRSAKTNKVITLTEGEISAGKFTGGDRDFGREVNKFLKKESRLRDVMQRRSVRKYLARKHGTKFWCFFACKQKDAVDTKFRDAKTRFKYKMIERIIYPMSPKLGLIMDCLLAGGSGEKCSNESFRKRGIDRSTISDAELDDIIKQVNENPNMRLSQIMTKKLLAKFMNDTAAKKAVSAIPAVGWIYLAVSAVDMLDQADKCLTDNCLSRYAADLNSSQYLEYYSKMRTANDEVKAGVSSADEVGALVDQFGGDHPAEESRVYQAYNGSTSVTFTSGSKAYAAEKDPYTCANGQPIPKGELVCPEKKVTRTFGVEDIRNNNLVSGLADIINKYRCFSKDPITHICVPGPQRFVHEALGAIDAIASKIMSPVVQTFLDALGKIPKVGEVMSYAQRMSGELIHALFEKVFPLPVQVDSPGREKYDGLQAGGEVAAREFGQGGYTEDGQPYGLGGKELSAKEQVTVLQNYNEQQDYNYQNSSLLAKLTDTDYPNSLANRVIAAMPTSFNQLVQGFASMITKPFSSIGSLWRPVYAAQADTANVNAFGIPRVGYAVDDPALTADPEKYTEAYCKQEQAGEIWKKSKTENKVTGFEEYSQTNPCLLERVAVEAASSVFTNTDSLEDN